MDNEGKKLLTYPSTYRSAHYSKFSRIVDELSTWWVHSNFARNRHHTNRPHSVGAGFALIDHASEIIRFYSRDDRSNGLFTRDQFPCIELEVNWSRRMVKKNQRSAHDVLIV